MTRQRLFIEDCGIVTSLGRGKRAVAKSLFADGCRNFTERDDLLLDRSVKVGAVEGELLPLPDDMQHLDCRNNRLMQVAVMEIAPAIRKAIDTFGRQRIAVILGTSTSGISDAEAALTNLRRTSEWPQGFNYQQQESSNLSLFAARLFGLLGPVYTVSTACSSSAKVFASARRLIQSGLADAAIVGGTDTIGRMTLQGFDALGLLSKDRCNPFSLNRDGITIGEGASAFLLTTEPADVELRGIGETSDAHHLTAPDPDGTGARSAMAAALLDSGVRAEDVAYINLHGTATPLNDAMEAKALAGLFRENMPCSSTKAMTGHMLGASGGCEAGFLWLTLHKDYNPLSLLPPHIWDAVRDPALPALNLIGAGTPFERQGAVTMLSNSFGFGGSNVTLALGA